MAPFFRLAALLFTALAVAFACSDNPKRAGLADGCTINTDCTSPLVCAFSRCHNACTSTRDCPASERCVVSDRPFNVCQLPSEKSCSHNSECPLGQVCGVDGECRDACKTDRDCIVGQLCVSGSCADPSDLDGGRLPVLVEGGAASGVTGQPCDYTSECPSGLSCRSGLCVYECLASVDCPEGKACVSHRCVAPAVPLPDAALDGGPPPGAGTECSYNSECPAPLACRGGICAYECLADVDCSTGERCVAHVCRVPGTTGGAGPDAGCVPATCLSASKNCGAIPDGCGGVAVCGSCPAGETCGGGGIANVCGKGACSPKSCAAQGKNCGVVSDGCSLPLDCGTCADPLTCGGGGKENVCGCKPAGDACKGKDCGTVIDECNNVLDCGSCVAPNTCGGAGTPDQCGCKKTTCGAVGAACGYVADGCGGVLNCGPCSSGVCGGGGTPNECGSGTCTPTTCQALGDDCGVVSDGCSGTLDCSKPGCKAPETCGGGGEANVCGCTPTTCAAESKNCGTIPDGCGKVLDCGACTAPRTCGGGGKTNVCGCVPTTCAAQKKNCGTISDGCGGLLDCGGCTTPEVCGGSGIPNVCAVSERPPSCLGGGEGAGQTCGTTNDDCCASLLVPAGSFDRDGDPNYPATVSAYRLDKYLVTVGRFRAFVDAGKGVQSSPPADWSGGFPKIPNSGWNPAWTPNLAPTTGELEKALKCDSFPVWTDGAGQSDNNPMSCATWYEAMAFCAWDNAWLQTEVELSYAQQGGDEQRYFPWSSPPGSQTIDITYANFNSLPGTTSRVISVGSKSPKGDGRWGQTDLVGNMYELTMDAYSSPYAQSACSDCAYLGSFTNDRVIRSGSWNTGVQSNTFRTNEGIASRFDQVGFRCARLP